MFWQANKAAVCVLVAGLVISFAAYFYIGNGNIELAKQVLATAICATLFLAALASFLQAKSAPTLCVEEELTAEHFEQMAELEAQYYGSDCITPPAEAYRWYRRYPASTIAATMAGKVVAFVNLFPVQEHIYNALREGTFNDSELTLEQLADPQAESEEPLHMFLCCVLTEPPYRGVGLTRHLLRLAVQEYEDVQHRCRRIITLNITREGADFSRRYGFQELPNGHDTTTRIFEQEYADFVATLTGTAAEA